MWCSRLILENIRSYRKSEIELSKGINLIVGPNNSGKSTILRALLRFQTADRNENGYLRNEESEGNISAVFEDSKDPHFGIQKGSGIIDLPYSSQHEVFARISSNPIQFTYQPRNNGSLKETEFKIFSASEPDNIFYPFFSKRNYFHDSSNFNEENIYRVTHDLRNLTSRVEKLVNPSHLQHENFSKACQEILNFKVGTIIKKEQKYIGIYTSDSQSIPLYAMGEGVANILGILSIIFTKNRKIFLIEELENDLHPKALKRLLEIILEKSSQNQFIFTTHSNIVLKHLGSDDNAKIFRTSWEPFYIDEDKIKIPIPTSYIEEVDNDSESRMKLLDYLGYDLLDFDMWKACIIFEESSAERIVRDFLIPHFTPELRGKVLTIAANGVDDVTPKFTDLHRLFVYAHKQPLFNKRAWVIVDGDEAGLGAIRDIKKKFPSWDERHFISLNQPDFECYYPQKFQKRAVMALSISNKKEKRTVKKKLLNDVLKWIDKDKKKAHMEFHESASEVIGVLNKISESLNLNNR